MSVFVLGPTVVPFVATPISAIYSIAQTVITSKTKNATAIKRESGPKIEIAIGEVYIYIEFTPNIQKAEPPSLCRNAVLNLTPEPNDIVSRLRVKRGGHTRAYTLHSQHPHIQYPSLHR